uniref:Uncharacterized protein n=1 Tax=Euplotes crassus TaxID=5936 RepID=A0A7S3KWT4_EUPCR|mmetsp:Transcript_9704/g.9519  ORF Transcript_9704/g.9519 Transcript_9704/m.9519 type:complete len:432 (+) Transcript_9704:752-2047(+)
MELGKIGYKLNKEAIYIDDKEYENDYKALVGLKFDHKALQCFDNCNKMKLPFRFRLEMSRTFTSYLEKYGDAIRTMAYPTDPMMCPNQKLDRPREISPQRERFSQRSNERRLSYSPRGGRDNPRGDHYTRERRSSERYRRRDEMSPSRSPSPKNRRSEERKEYPKEREDDYHDNHDNKSVHSYDKDSRRSDRGDNQSEETICYLFGVPIDATNNDIIDELDKRGIHKPVKVEKGGKDNDFGDSCVYFSLKFDVPISVDKLLEQEVSIFGKNVLIIPRVDNIPIKKLVPYHQVLVTFNQFSPGLNLLNHSNCSQEIPYLHNFFAKYGKIVDLNLEYMPSCFVVTYTRHENVLELLEKRSLDYMSNNNTRLMLNINKMNFILPVRSGGSNHDDSDFCISQTYMPKFLKKSMIDSKAASSDMPKADGEQDIIPA